MASPAKKSRHMDTDELLKSQDIKIYIMPRGIQKQRLSIFKKRSDMLKIPLVAELSSEVTQIVTAVTNVQDVFSTLKCGKSFIDDNKIEIVKDAWLSKCLECKKIVPVPIELKLYPGKNFTELNVSSGNEDEKNKRAGWVFFKPIPLKHYNKHLTDALEVLQIDADFRHEKTDTHQNHYSRALAFRRTSSVLKTLPYKVTSQTLSLIKGMPHIGDRHAYRVIQEIVEEGFSSEVDSIENDEWFIKMKLFTKTFGVGAATAKKWINMGLSSIEEARQHPDVLTTSTQIEQLAVGLAYYEDLAELVNKTEAEALAAYIRQEVENILPGSTVDLTGGFRRGKDAGHDIDLLISHPEEGRETEILPKLINRLTKYNIILYNNYERSSYSNRVLSDARQKGEYLKSTLDYFEKWIGVLKMDRALREPGPDGRPTIYDPAAYTASEVLARPTPSMDSVEASEYRAPRLRRQASWAAAVSTARGERTWLARRVDLIITPASQYPWALVGWTGSRHLNRELRRYVEKEKDGKLTSHGMYHYPSETVVAAKTEAEVFEKLGVPHLDPIDRNA